MNFQHLKAFLWLRWRLMANQWRRAGTFNNVFMIILVVGAVLSSIPLAAGAFALGVYVFPKTTPDQLLLATDVLIVTFLFFWMIGLITDLQRSEPLSLSKFMHLPVSAKGAFLINYISSLARLSLILFVPMMLGFAFALLYVQGLRQWLVIPLLASFFLMITALTYQFQGWLASLMNNPRKRRTVIVTTSALFILVFQIPNLINLSSRRNDPPAPPKEAKSTAKTDLASQPPPPSEPEDEQARQKRREADRAARRRASRERFEYVGQIARPVNAVLPIGWLPLGVAASSEGRLLPPLLGFAGMTGIGLVALWRAYNTTVGQYQGRSSSRSPQAVKPNTRTPGATATRKPLLLEARLPGLSEPVSAIALGGFSSLMRAPEAKLAFLTPIIICAIFGSMILSGRAQISEWMRPLLATGGLASVLLGVLQLASNQFGIDRDGFRMFVLSSASRRDILLGKNLSYLPVVLVMAAVLLAVIQFLTPMRVDHFLALFPQFVSMLALFFLVTNLLSIYTPYYMVPGSLNASGMTVKLALVQLLVVTILFPLTQGLVLLPLGIDLLLDFLGVSGGFPVCLVLSLLECALVIPLFHFALQWQGRMLQDREQAILETITNRAA